MSDRGAETEAEKVTEIKTLILLLVISGGMSAVEGTLGWFSHSAGLIADSVDLLAHALFYGVSLCVVGGRPSARLRANRLGGVLQMVLGVLMMGEVLRRGLIGNEPNPIYMIFVSLVALLANVACLVIIAGYRPGAAPRDPSWLSSKNDVLSNLGVTAAGGLVSLTRSAVPDLLIGCLISGMLIRGGFGIFRESRRAARDLPVA